MIRTNIRVWKSLLMLLTSALLFGAGCSREINVKVQLTADEQLDEKAPVLLNGAPAGYVRALRVESGERVALVALARDGAAQQPLKAGTVALIENGRIHLRTDTVRADAPILSSGALIPTQGKTEFTVKRYATKQTLVWAGIAVVAVLLVCLCFKSVLHLGILVLCLGLAGLTAWLLNDYITPHIEQLYASAPTDGAGDVEHNPSGEEGMHPSDGADAAEPVKDWQSKIVQVLELRPHPRVVAFAGAFVITLIPYSLLLSGVLRTLRRKN